MDRPWRSCRTSPAESPLTVLVADRRSGAVERAQTQARREPAPVGRVRYAGCPAPLRTHRYHSVLAPIRAPLDSALLTGAMRVLLRLLRRA